MFIFEQLKSRKKDYSVFSLTKVKAIAKELNIERIHSYDREELLNIIRKVNEDRLNLRYRALKYARKLAKDLGI
jgi:hypothetical protein